MGVLFIHVVYSTEGAKDGCLVYSPLGVQKMGVLFIFIVYSWQSIMFTVWRLVQALRTRLIDRFPRRNGPLALRTTDNEDSS